jgi:hypothetical protein
MSPVRLDSLHTQKCSAIIPHACIWSWQWSSLLMSTWCKTTCLESM